MKKTVYLVIILTLALSACKKSDNPVDVDDTDNKVELIENKNIIALYGFNENSEDGSKNKIHLTQNDITFKKDRNSLNNSSASFNGTTSYLKSSQDSRLNLSENYTLSVWIKPSLKDCKLDLKNYIDLFGRWSATGSNTSTYSICLLSDGRIQGRTYNSSELGNTWIETKEKVNDNEWNNIIVTRKSNGYLRVYLNGELVGLDISSSPQISNYELFVGKRRDDWSYFAGEMDDLIILDEFTKECDILEVMNYNIK